jgi:hypothetical protein
MTRVYEAAAVSVAIRLSVFDCAHCGVLFGISTQLEKRRRDDGEGFYCPNGHANEFKDNELDKAKKRIAKLEEIAKARDVWLREERDRREAVERSLAATRGAVTKLRQKTDAGLCPYGCRRHFTNLERHIATKHKDELLEPEKIA